MAQRTNANNNPFRKAPTVEPKKPAVPPAEESKKTEAADKKEKDNTENMITVTEKQDTESKRTAKPEKKKGKPGRKPTVEGGATERITLLLNKEIAEKFSKYCKENRYTQSELLREMIVKMLSETKRK